MHQECQTNQLPEINVSSRLGKGTTFPNLTWPVRTGGKLEIDEHACVSLFCFCAMPLGCSWCHFVEPFYIQIWELTSSRVLPSELGQNMILPDKAQDTAVLWSSYIVLALKKTILSSITPRWTETRPEFTSSIIYIPGEWLPHQRRQYKHLLSSHLPSQSKVMLKPTDSYRHLAFAKIAYSDILVKHSNQVCASCIDLTCIV